MAPEIGNLFLYILACLCLLNASVAVAPTTNKKTNSTQLILTTLMVASATASFFSLMYCFIISDFSVYNVYLNSHTSKPLIFKIAATWGTHEGSLLLWLLCMAFITLLYCFLTPKGLVKKLTISIQSFVVFAFTIYTIFISNPFVRLFPKPINGLGFNPILQDIGIAFHPPVLYFGYVGFSIVFSMALALLITKSHEKDAKWAKTMLLFTLIPWTFLTLGIGLGSWWAYRELGWGGYWFWDPVENASLLPWLVASALIHSLIAVSKAKQCIFWSLLLALTSFLFTTCGTFIVRSGIITSVHSFASSPERGFFILAFLSIIFAISIGLLFWRSSQYKCNENKQKRLFITTITLNNIMFFTLAITILVATIYPFVIDIILKQKVFVGAEYFNSVAIPLALLQLFICIVASDYTIYNPKLNFGNLWQKHKRNFLLSFIFTGIIVYINKTPINVNMLSVAIAIWLALTLLSNFTKYLKSKKYSTFLGHMGFATLILGIAFNANFSQELHLNMKLGSTYDFAKFKVELENLHIKQKDNYLARNAVFNISTPHKFLGKINSEIRVFPVEKMQTTEAGILNRGYYNIYITSGEFDEDSNKLMVRLMYHPFINLLWLACLLMVMGGVTAVLQKLLRTP